MGQRTYVITGSASGIGAATSELLKERGARVIGIDIHDSDIEVDLSTVEGRSQAINQATDLSNANISGLIACAGLVRPVAQTVAVNYFGVVDFVNGLLPVLQSSQAPRVAITSSMASLLPNSPALVLSMLAGDETGALEIAQALVDEGRESANLIYGSTKRALSRWIRRECIRPEWAGAGIPLNAVGPGLVETPMSAKMLEKEESKAAADAVVPMPLNYHLKAREVAYLLAWLTSAENTHTTGQTIYIDGGADVSLRGENIWN